MTEPHDEPEPSPCKCAAQPGKYTRYQLMRDAMGDSRTTLRCCLLMVCGSASAGGLVTLAAWLVSHLR
jgi:hypothetical protein